MAIPRQLILIAVGAAAAGVYLVVRNKMQAQESTRTPAQPSPPSPPAAEDTTATSRNGSTMETPGLSGSMRELALFLAGESWYDEVGWHVIWEREGVGTPEQWLRTSGKGVLVNERKKLAEHPALLAGCRRRWIVVCRYAGIEVGDAASLWNATEA
jgi:hypothetical protein